MKVTQLAKSLETSADTVRYYTRLGFLKPSKSVNGYKIYSANDKSRLKFILGARQLSFTVADIEDILKEADDGKSACPLVREIIKQRLQETEKQFQAMLALRSKMTAALKQWEQKEDKAPTSHMVCHLIEKFGISENGESTHDS